MTLVDLTQGPYNLSIRENGILIWTPLHNQESFVPSSQQPSSRQFPVIRKTNPHFYTSALGLAGCVGLIVSCVWSVLLPAIGSVGFMAFAYLLDKKITLLHAKELPPAAAKSQHLFEQRIGSEADLLNELVNTDNLPPPMLPMPNATNQIKPNAPPPLPLPGSKSLLDEPINTGNLSPPMLPMPNAANQIKPNVPPPPPPPPPLSSLRGLLEEPINTGNLSSSSPAQKEEVQKTAHTLEDPKEDLLSSIKNSFNFMQIKRILKENSEKYPSNLLLKELKTTYARALDISKSERINFWKGYFEGKVDSFEESFDIEDQEKDQTTKYTDMEDICEKASHLDSLLKNMNWVKSLLYVLSERKDLSDKARNHCSKKLERIDKHIGKLQGRNEKKSKESSSSQTVKTPEEILLKALNEKFSPQQDDESQNSKSNEIKTEEKTLEQKLQERDRAIHGDGTSDDSDTEAHDSDWD